MYASNRTRHPQNRTSAWWNFFRRDFSTCQRFFFAIVLVIGRWIEAEDRTFGVNVKSVLDLEITVSAVICAARIFRYLRALAYTHNATIFFETQLKRIFRFDKIKSNALGICDCDLLVFFVMFFLLSLPMFRLGVGVFISACEINISSCHLNCVMLWLYTILFLHNTLNTFRISISVCRGGFGSLLRARRKEDRRN